jgi:hypothetical protein
MNVRELSQMYLEKTLENPDAAGSPYTLICPAGTRYPVVGTVSDTSILVDPITGESIINRTIITTCLIKRLPVQPERGWRADIPDLWKGGVHHLYIQEVNPDNTIGLYYFTMGFNLEEPEEMEA